MIQVGKIYRYNGEEWVIAELSSLVDSDGEIVSAVSYKRTEPKIGAIETEVFVRSRISFERLFIPTTLEIGDGVVGMYDNTTIAAKFEVININDEANTATIRDMWGDTTVVSRDIAENGRLTVVEKESEDDGVDSHTRTRLDLYYRFADMKERLLNSSYISKMTEMLTTAATRIQNISPSNISPYSLEEAMKTIRQTINIIYTKFGIF